MKGDRLNSKKFLKTKVACRTLVTNCTEESFGYKKRGNK